MAQLSQAIESAVSRALAGEKRAGLLFSGGIDSAVLAFLAKKSAAPPLLICAGIEGAEDVRFAEKISAELGMPLRVRTIAKDELPGLVDRAKEISGETNFMKLELGVLLLACCDAAESEGIRLLISGAGAEELFLGYSSHSKAHEIGEDLDALRRLELEGLFEKDLRRSGRIAAHFGIRLALPYLDEGVVAAALALPAAGNFKNGENKSILRGLARRLGVPETACSRPKRAMQYGSGIHGPLLRLRKRCGF